MSVRAYKVIEIKTEKMPTFNCWHDEKILELASNSDEYNDGGLLYFDKDTIQQAYNSAIQAETLDNDYIDTLQAIIKDADADGYIQYYCF